MAYSSASEFQARLYGERRVIVNGGDPPVLIGFQSGAWDYPLQGVGGFVALLAHTQSVDHGFVGAWKNAGREITRAINLGLWQALHALKPSASGLRKPTVRARTVSAASTEGPCFYS